MKFSIVCVVCLIYKMVVCFYFDFQIFCFFNFLLKLIIFKEYLNSHKVYCQLFIIVLFPYGQNQNNKKKIMVIK
jgi:hypothetical protein